MRQTTIRHTIQCSGVGLHSGKKVNLTLRPADENTGIVFHVRTHNGVQDIFPEPGAVIATGLATTLGKNGAHVSTVEHLLAALRGLGIDNLHIDADGGEIPILDGSAAPFALLTAEAGIREQRAYRRVLRIKKSVTFTRGNKFIKAAPHDGFHVDYTIDFPHPAIGVQRMSLEITPTTFAEIAKARTFGFLHEVEYLKTNGQALGGSLSNAIVLDERGVVNTEGLRYTNEFVRHKILDFVGDMAMMPLPLQGHFTVHCSGHSLNNEFLRHINDAQSLYLEEQTLMPRREAPQQPLIELGGRRAPAAYAPA